MKYSESEEKLMTETYTAAEDKQEAVMELVEQLGRSKTSVIAKLTSMGIYQKKKVYQPKSGITKKEMIHRIAMAVDAEPEYLQGIEKSAKPALEYLMKRTEAEIELLKTEIKE